MDTSWMNDLPAYPTAPAAPPAQTGLVMPALTAGWHELVGSMGSAEQAVGTGLGMQGLANYGKSVADNRKALAAAAGNPELEKQGFGSVAGAGYQVVKALPSFLPMVGAQFIPGLGQAADATGLARLGAMAPEFLGGGAKLGKHVLGAAIGSLPQTVGGNVEAYKDAHGGELTQGAALGSIAAGVPEAALMGVAPAIMKDASITGVGPQNIAGSVARALLRGGVSGAAAAPQAALQSLLTSGFGDPNKSMTERAHDAVHAAVGGAVVGGAVGTALHAISSKPHPAADTTNDDLAATVNAATTPPAADQAAQPNPADAKAADAMQTAVARSLPPRPDKSGMMGPFALMPESDLRGRIDTLNDKMRTPDENMEHALLHEELAARTKPGNPVGQGELWTPEQTGQRAAASKKFMEEQGYSEDHPVYTSGVTSEPELINALPDLLAAADKKKGGVSAKLLDVAEKYGYNEDGELRDLPGELAAKQGEVNAAWDKVKANKQSGMDARLTKAAQAKQAELQPIRDLIALHEQADEAMKSQNEPTPEAKATEAAAAENDIPPPPAMDPEVAEHFQRMSNLAALLADENPEEAGKARRIANSLQESTGGTLKGAIRDARRLALTNKDVLDEHAAELAKQPAEEPAATTETTEASPDHPLITDGSQFDWSHPDTEPTEVEPKAGPNGNPILADQSGTVAPVTPIKAVSPAEHVANIEGGLRARADEVMADPNTPDAQRKLLQKAKDKADAGDHSSLSQALNAIETAKQAKNPDGPFTNDQKVVGTASTRPADVGLIGGLMRALKMGNIRVLLSHPDDVTGAAGDAHGLYGDYAAARLTPKVVAEDPTQFGHVRQFGPENNDFSMYVDPNLPDAQRITAIAHEVGHISDKVLLSQAGDSTKAAIEASFQKWLKATQGMKAQDMIRLMRAKALAEGAASKLDPNMLVSDMPKELQDYYRSKSEWWADQTAKYLLKSERAPARTAVGQFFQRVADRWRDLFSAITGKEYAPDAEVKKFYDNVMRSKTERMWGGDTDNSVKFAKNTEDVIPRTVPEISNAAQAAVQGRLKTAESIIPAKLSGPLPRAIRQQLLYAAPTGDMVKFADTHLNFQSPKQFYETNRTRQSMNVAALRPLTNEVAATGQLSKRGQIWQQKMRDHINYGIDPRVAFADQPDLHERANSDLLKARADQANKDWAWGRQNEPEAFKSLQRLDMANRFAGQGEGLARLDRFVKGLQANGEAPIPGYDDGFFARHQFDTAAQADIQLAHDNVTSAFKNNIDVLTKHVGGLADTATTLDAAAKAAEDPQQAAEIRTQANATRRTMDDIKMMLKLANGTLSAMDKPYNHLGREGSFMVGGHITLDGKLPSETAMDAIQKAVADNGFDVSLMRDHDNNKIYARVKNESQLANLSKIFGELRQQGHLTGDIVHGDIGDLDISHSMVPEDVRTFADRLNNTELTTPIGADEKTVAAMEYTKRQLVNDVYRTYLDSLGDNALPKYLTERATVQGFSKNWQNNMLQRFSTSARAMATMAMAADKSTAIRAMQEEVQAAKRVAPGQQVDPKRALQMQDYANEMLTREKQRGWEAPNNPLGFMTRVTHAISIGTSPAYVFTLGSQFATLVWPELAKTHGYVGAATAMARAAPRMFNILRASIHNGEFVVDADRYRKFGVSEKDIATMTRADNAGFISTNSLTQMLTAMQAGEHGNKINRYSNLLGYTSEMMPKVMSALAAGDLYDARPVKGVSREDFINRVTDESNMDYGIGSSPRALGQHGIFGSATPLIMQFQGFHVRLMSKYFREMHELLTNDSGNRAEAGKFLAGHLLAITALAGTMGLPGAGLFAGVADKTMNALTGRDDYDVEALYRGYLKDTFGSDVGEAIATGAPRMAGVDFSHLGESHIIPLTELAASKRKFEDARADYLERLGGPSLGEASDLIEGGRDLVNGFYQQGFEKILPGELKNMAKAYHMSERGYEDKNGLKLPLTPGAQDIMLRVLGIQNQKKAAYDEEHETMQDLMATRTYRAQNIARTLEMAVNHGDREQFQSGLKDAYQYTVEHPGLASPLAMVGRNTERFTKQGAIARAGGMILGQKPTDLGLKQQLGWGNWRQAGEPR